MPIPVGPGGNKPRQLPTGLVQVGTQSRMGGAPIYGLAPGYTRTLQGTVVKKQDSIEDALASMGGIPFGTANNQRREQEAAKAAADRAHQERLAAINAEIAALKNQRYTPPMWSSATLGDQYQGDGVSRKTRRRGSSMRANNQLKVSSANTGGGSTSTANLG